jgi:hypothetical protein
MPHLCLNDPNFISLRQWHQHIQLSSGKSLHLCLINSGQTAPKELENRLNMKKVNLDDLNLSKVSLDFIKSYMKYDKVLVYRPDGILEKIY